MKKIILLITIILLAFNCNDNPVDSKPENQRPIIFSLTVFPDVIRMQDSAIVICNAMDPDADTLVYDWITDGRLKIKGALSGDNSLFNTLENSRIFYPNQTQYFYDTVWVQCFARDRKGKSDSKLIIFTVIRDSI